MPSASFSYWVSGVEHDGAVSHMLQWAPLDPAPAHPPNRVPPVAARLMSSPVYFVWSPHMSDSHMACVFL